MTIQNIFNSYNIELIKNGVYRHPIDILEDIYLKLSTKEYDDLVKTISRLETKDGHIFDDARDRPYE